ncbi:MAG: amidohydrolase, partial [Chloroflexaceae bacterium]|nr:amidohydrolase [Chloroflexaceae bacterium]
PSGGYIQRDKAGQATGVLFESAMQLVQRVIPPPTPAERLDGARLALAEAASYGMTSVHIPTIMSQDDGGHNLGDLKLLYERGELTLRCLSSIAATDLDFAIALGMRSGLGDRMLRIGGLKIFADGALGSQTAEMLQPYEGSASKGMAVLPEEELRALVARANANGISVLVHAIGDAAVRKVLDAIEAAGRPPLAMLNRIEHAQIVSPRDLHRFGELGVIASMQPIHATSDMEMADQLWGERCVTAYAWRTLLDAGATLAFGSDAPVDSFNPWHGVHAAVTRQKADGTPPGGWHSQECLTVEEALRAYCVGPALASGEAHEKGILAPGMLADLAVLNADPFKIPPRELRGVMADITMVEGRVVFER